MAKFTEGRPATNAELASAPVRDNLDALFQMDLKSLRPRAQSSPNMTLQVAGDQDVAYLTGLSPLNFSGGNSPVLTAPSGNNRISVLSIDYAGTLSWTNGTEAASPSEPTMPGDKIPLCTVFCRTGMTSIKNTDDSTNGFIQKDRRPFVHQPGGLVLIQPQTASSSSTIDFTFGVSSIFDQWLLTLTNIVPATDNVELWVRLSQSASFLSGASDYQWQRDGALLGVAWAQASDTADSQIIVAANVSSGSGRQLSGHLLFSNLAESGHGKMVRGDLVYVNNGGSPAHVLILGNFAANTNAVDGIRVMMSSGNIASGSLALYGIRK